MKANQVPDGFVLAKETVVEMPDGSKEIGYTTIGRVGIFNSAEEVFDAIRELDLPLGWVSMTTEQLLPGWMLAGAPAAPAAGAPPENCRQRLATEGKPYPRSSCTVCGKFSPKWRECDAALAANSANGVV